MSFHNNTWSTGHRMQGRLPDAFVNNKNNLQSKKQPSEQPQNSSLTKFKNKKKSAILSISKTRKSLAKMLRLCQNLKSVQRGLRLNVHTLTDEEWRESMKCAEEQKMEIKKLETSIEQRVDTLKSALLKRANKRARIKRQRSKIQSQKLQEELVRSQKHDRIDDWLQRMKEELNTKKKEEEFKLRADIVLKDVQKRKADGRRCLALFEALNRLREAREKSALGRGEKLNTADAEKFSICIGKLERIWNLALEKYIEEEESLSRELRSNEGVITTENPAIIPLPTTDDTLALWKNILFGGPDAVPLNNCEDNEHFMAIRCGWDQYICSCEDGSSIPVGWVLPPQEPNSKWKQYLAQED